MVSAELHHNPFLLETKVSFNGRRPQVNSTIRKYEGKPLIDWVEDVPRLFHDEMNGYDFDLFFTGTDLDFERVVSAFRKSGAPDGSVRVIRKGSLAAPAEKLDEVLSLIEWLGENYNPHLDLERILKDNQTLIDASFPLIILHGNAVERVDRRMSTELYDSAEELDGSSLADTPILIDVTPKSLRRASDDVLRLLSRDDIVPGQLFFSIHSAPNRAQIIRALSDLGAHDPQVVVGADDPSIYEYSQGHLVSAYVRNAIRVLEAETVRVESELRSGAARCEQSYAFREENIGAMNDEIVRLESVDDSLSQLCPVEAPREFAESRQLFKDAVLRWWGRKRRLEGETEGRMVAADLGRTIQQLMDRFTTALGNATNEARVRIDTELTDVYVQAGIDTGFRPLASPMSFPTASVTPELVSQVLTLNEKTFVDQRHDFFGLFGGASSPDEATEVTVYLLDAWRAKALEVTEPTLDLMEEAYARTLRMYQQWAINSYRSHIVDLISEKRDRQERLVAMMSDDEKAMRNDSDWLATLKARLQDIKRG